MSQPLLLELLTEELPPGDLATLGESLHHELARELQKAKLLPDNKSGKSFATPRRLAVLWPEVLARQPDSTMERKGPSVTAAFDAEGRPTAALMGFLRSAGADLAQIERVQEGKSEYVFVRQAQKGQLLPDLLPALLMTALKRLPMTKTMSWGDRTDKFIRPVRGLTVLHGDRALTLSLFGVVNEGKIYGHRMLAPQPLMLARATDYVAALESTGYVIPEFASRREKIRMQLDYHAGQNRWLASDKLLDEVTALVEWPVVLEGRFDAQFLSVPRECLILTMQKHQKYFPLAGIDGQLLPRFLMVANLPDSESAIIRRGNERVLRARLADAEFFFHQDKKQPLAARVSQLQQVVFYRGLGSQHDRVERIVRLSTQLARLMELSPLVQQQVEVASRLCKADLLTSMVIEFPELQGIIGHHYALAEGQAEPIACAIEDHYRPRFAGDELPRNSVGLVVALADKMDMLVGFFGIGVTPTADKDPFGLRRAAMGVVRLLRLWPQSPSFHALIALAQENYATGQLAKESDTLVAFLQERLRSVLREEGWPSGHIEAVLAVDAPLSQLVPRLQALQSFLTHAEASNLVAVYKRISNILRKFADQSEVPLRRELLREPAEQALNRALDEQYAVFTDYLAHKNYDKAMVQIARLKPQVDRFFDEILVMAPDEDVRTNRLVLLRQVQMRMAAIADISHVNLEPTT